MVTDMPIQTFRIERISIEEHSQVTGQESIIIDLQKLKILHLAIIHTEQI